MHVPSLSPQQHLLENEAVREALATVLGLFHGACAQTSLCDEGAGFTSLRMSEALFAFSISRDPKGTQPQPFIQLL